MGMAVRVQDLLIMSNDFIKIQNAFEGVIA